MAHQRKSTSLKAITIFIILVIIGGYMLSASGNFDNPFDEIMFLRGVVSGEDQRFVPEFNIASSSLDALPQDGNFQLPENGGDLPPLVPDGISDRIDGISWSLMGDVLFNVWFICAVTAVFIVFQQVKDFIAKQIKVFKSPVPLAR